MQRFDYVAGFDISSIAGKVPVVGQSVEHGARASNIVRGRRGIGAPGGEGIKLCRCCHFFQVSKVATILD